MTKEYWNNKRTMEKDIPPTPKLKKKYNGKGYSPTPKLKKSLLTMIDVPVCY
jgi:hypothetical protein